MYPNAIGLWPEEQLSLLWLALNATAGNFLEIGSFCGGSAVLLNIARRVNCDGPHTICVDRTFTGWNNAFQKNVFRVGKFKDICTTLEIDSADLQSHYKHQFAGQPITLAFIDGWHSFAAILRDFEQIEPFLVTGSFVVFHDVAKQPYSLETLGEFTDRALKYKEEWTAAPLDKWSGKNLGVAEYHQSEAQQDFLLDEAVAYILHSNSHKEVRYEDGSVRCQEHEPIYELVSLPSDHYKCDHRDMAGEYVHGRTSPYHGLVALRKIR